MAALLIAVLVLLMLTAALTVSTIGTQTPTSFLLGAYVVVWAEVVSLALVLSIFHAFGRAGLLIGAGFAFAAAAAAWTSRGYPRPPAFFPALLRLRTEMVDPVLGILAATVMFVMAYAVILGLEIPQNEWDSLTYHLTRAAFWIQQGAVAYVPHVTDIRINGNPPNAEIGMAWTMLLGGSDRFVWLPALSAVPALMLGIYGVARRAALGASEALFGAFIFACLPLVLLQSSTAMNDLVLASFFVCATYFSLGTNRGGMVGAGLSLGLAIGTKIAAPLLLPIYLVVVFVARRRRFLDQVVVVILGLSLGAVWYVVNFAQTGAFDGGMVEVTGQSADRQPALILTRAYQLLLESIELPGARPAWNVALIYVGAALLAIAGAVAFLRGRRRPASSLGIASLIICATPTLLVIEGRGLSWIWRTGWDALGRSDLADQIAPFQLSTFSDSTATWYGPTGTLLIVGGIIMAIRSSGVSRPLRVALAAAPFAFLLVLAAGIPFDPWRGRFFVFPIALAAATWGLAYRLRALAWAAAGLTVVTVVLVLVNSYTKPPGRRLIAHATTASVFGKPRARVQTWIRNDGTDEVVEYFEVNVPPDANVGLSLGYDDFSYPYFGADLGRTVRFITHKNPAVETDGWIVVAPGHDVVRCAAVWETALETTSGYRVLRRTAADSC
jgi:hypothetical protein